MPAHLDDRQDALCGYWLAAGTGGLTWLLHDGDAKRCDTAKGELLAGGGRWKAPCLRVVGAAGGERWIYELKGIIAYRPSHRQKLIGHNPPSAL